MIQKARSKLLAIRKLFACSILFLPCQISATFATAADDTGQRAVASFKAGHYAEACPLFEKLVERDSADLRAQYYLALVCQKLGQNDRATLLFEKIITASPASAEARYSQIALQNPTQDKFSGSDHNSSASSPGAAASLLTPVPSRDLQDAQAQAAQIIGNAKRQSDELNARADRIAKEMAAVPRFRGYGSAYMQSDIDAETAGLRRQAADATARAKRESDDIINRAKLRDQTASAGSSVSNRSSSLPGSNAGGNSSILSSINGTTTYAVTPSSSRQRTASTAVATSLPTVKSASVPHINEIEYWQKLKTLVSENDLPSALMLKPKYRADILSGKLTLQTIFDDNYSQPQRESDNRWVEEFKSQKLNFTPVKNIVAANYDIDQFVGYTVNKSGRLMDSDGVCYKVFFDFSDATSDLTPALYLKFSNALSDAGFVGDSKISTKPGFCRFFYNDIIVHTINLENAKIAERVGLAIFGARLAHTGRGLDVMMSKSNGVFSDNTDWHHFLAKSSDLSRLSARAISFVNFAD